MNVNSGWAARGARRVAGWYAAAMFAAGLSAPAAAIEVEVGDITTISVENLFTIGATFRTQQRDQTLVGKSNVTPGICLRRTSEPFDPQGNNTYAGDTCSATRERADGTNSNVFYINQPGAFSPNGDNGNLNFERGDVVASAAKLTADISFDLGLGGLNFNFFARPLFLFSPTYVDFTEVHPDTTLQFGQTDFPGAGVSRIGASAELLDGFVSTNLPFFGDRELAVKVGKQVLNWGESSFLALNSLNTINPPNAALLNVPGFDLKELLQPVGMVFASTDITDKIGLEGFYQYDWQPVVIDPVGSFFSVSDTLGEGGQLAMLSFGKAPEDPGFFLDPSDPEFNRYPGGHRGTYMPYRNPEDPTAVLGSRASRTVFRDFAEEARRRPKDGGQYGFALRNFLEDFNNGTELNFYFANYHSRIPSVGVIAAQATCVPDDTGNPATNIASLIQACGIPPENFVALAQQQAGADVTYMPATGEALPVDTLRVVVEYPENIKVYGLSFNTTVGDFAVSGEYAYRPKLPTQIQTTDLVFAGLQPAFPRDDFSLGVATLPGRRTAVPDFVTGYRGGTPGEVQPGQFIRGYEELKTGQLNITVLKLFGGDNILGASQITTLLETGLTHIIDFPELTELQFNGGQADTHISGGADGTEGIDPPDLRQSPPADDTLRQNPTAHQDLKAFGDQYSYGYRFVNLNRFDNAFAGINLETLFILRHDVSGTAPGLGTNFVAGRKQINFGLRFDYLARIFGEVRYTWFTGGSKRDSSRDRDNVQVYMGYQF